MQRNFIKHILLFDQLFQLLLIGMIILSLLTAVFFQPAALLWGLFALMPLGLWQLSSALVWGLLFRDRIRFLYFITAITFSSLFFTAGGLLDILELRLPHSIQEFAFFTGLLISFGGAIFYFIHSYRWHQLEYKQDDL